MEQLAKNFKNIRVKKGLTQKELGALVNTSKSFISQIENCHKIPSIPFLITVASSLDIMMYEFFIGI